MKPSTLKLHLDFTPINWNEYINKERSNKFMANKVKQQEKRLVQLECREKYKGNYPIEITFSFHTNSKRKDLDNMRIKGILDGLVSGGVLEEDNLNHIQKITLLPIFDDKEGVEIEIKELL